MRERVLITTRCGVPGDYPALVKKGITLAVEQLIGECGTIGEGQHIRITKRASDVNPGAVEFWVQLWGDLDADSNGEKE